jgi:HK97 gp10 family phage protein
MPVTLKSRIPEIAAEMEARLEATLEAAGELIVKGAKERVPVESGRLRDAIHVETTAKGVSVVAGSTEAFYGHMVENGTTHSAPHPFLVPAAEAAKDEIAAEATAALREL